MEDAIVGKDHLFYYGILERKKKGSAGALDYVFTGGRAAMWGGLARSPEEDIIQRSFSHYRDYFDKDIGEHYLQNETISNMVVEGARRCFVEITDPAEVETVAQAVEAFDRVFSLAAVKEWTKVHAMEWDYPIDRIPIRRFLGHLGSWIERDLERRGIRHSDLNVVVYSLQNSTGNSRLITVASAMSLYNWAKAAFDIIRDIFGLDAFKDLKTMTKAEREVVGLPWARSTLDRKIRSESGLLEVMASMDWREIGGYDFWITDFLSKNDQALRGKIRKMMQVIY